MIGIRNVTVSQVSNFSILGFGFWETQDILWKNIDDFYQEFYLKEEGNMLLF